MIQKKKDPQCLLLVDDNEEFLESIKMALELETDYEVVTLSDSSRVLNLLEELDGKIDVVITDLNMPGMSGDVLTNKVSHYDYSIPIIVFTGEGTRESKKRLLELGAWDFLEKGDSSNSPAVSSLVTAIDKVWAHAQRRRPLNKRGFIFRDEKMDRVNGMITKLAEIPSTVLIQGEPGTGKELIANEIHNRRLHHLMGEGERVTEKDYPYLAVNCGALSRTLLESQLFGHKKGAFTGSVSDQDGVFVAARKGTLFLDEITELDLDLQVKLLRALQEREVTPVGSNTALPVHARVVTATNRPIQQLVQEGKFRADLYYRINVVNLEVPPLRERKGDILPLARTFLSEIASEYNCAERVLTPEATEALLSYHWPGNVRELNNCIERSFALGNDPNSISVEDFPEEIRGTGRNGGGIAGFQQANQRVSEALETGLQSGSGIGTSTGDQFQTYDEVVADHIREALQRSRGVKSRAATLLSIDRNRLYRLIEKYKIQV